MTVLEFKRKKGWLRKEHAIVCAIGARTMEELAAEIRYFKAAVMDQDQAKGGNLVEIRLNLVAPATEHAEMEGYIRKVFDEEEVLSLLLRRRTFIVAILTPAGRLHKETTLS